MQAVGPILQSFQRDIPEIDSLTDVLQEIVHALQSLRRLGDILLQARGQDVQRVQILAPDGGVADQRLHLVERFLHVVEFLTVNSSRTDLLYPRSLVDDGVRLVPETTQYQIPIVEALAAGTALRRIAVITAVALIALLAADTLVTDAHSGFPVALLAGGANRVTLARVALHIRVAPEVRLTLVAPSTAESRPALASAVVRIAPA